MSPTTKSEASAEREGIGRLLVPIRAVRLRRRLAAAAASGGGASGETEPVSRVPVEGLSVQSRTRPLVLTQIGSGIKTSSVYGVDRGPEKTPRSPGIHGQLEGG
jgi:hypothetical protein